MYADPGVVGQCGNGNRRGACPRRTVVLPAAPDIPGIRTRWIAPESVHPRYTRLKLRSCRSDVAKPSLVGLPYEDVTITTSDHVKIKAYVIPARRNFISTAELKEMNEEQRKAAVQREIERWTKEMGEDDAVEVRQPKGIPAGSDLPSTQGAARL